MEMTRLEKVRDLERQGSASYDVYAKRNGKCVKFNKKPMFKKESEKMIGDLKKSKIPSVDIETVEMIKV